VAVAAAHARLTANRPAAETPAPRGSGTIHSVTKNAAGRSEASKMRLHQTA
jgi:hypothetical protein